jgi:hypothetical protein
MKPLQKVLEEAIRKPKVVPFDPYTTTLTRADLDAIIAETEAAYTADWKNKAKELAYDTAQQNECAYSMVVYNLEKAADDFQREHPEADMCVARECVGSLSPKDIQYWVVIMAVLREHAYGEQYETTTDNPERSRERS